MEFWDIDAARLRRRVGALVVCRKRTGGAEVVGKVTNYEGSKENGFQPLYTVEFEDGEVEERLGPDLDSRRREGHAKLGLRVRLHDARVRRPDESLPRRATRRRVGSPTYPAPPG